MTVGLVLGAAVWADGPSPTLRRRTLHGAALYHDGIVDHLVLCGGLGQHPPSEAVAMGRLLRDANVPDTAITLEDQSSNTGQNIRNAAALIDGQDVIIITDWYHAPRARLIARRAGLQATSSSPPLQGAKPLTQLKMALREVPAYFAYALNLKR